MSETLLERRQEGSRYRGNSLSAASVSVCHTHHSFVAVGLFQSGEEEEEEEEEDVCVHGDDISALRKGVPSLQKWTLVSIAFLNGITANMTSVPLKVYMIDTLQIAPSIQAVISVVGGAPYNLMFICAVVSDILPICGQRRKPYIILGALVQSVGWMVLSILPETVGFLGVFAFVTTLGKVIILATCEAIYAVSGERRSPIHLNFAVAGKYQV